MSAKLDDAKLLRRRVILSLASIVGGTIVAGTAVVHRHLPLTVGGCIWVLSGFMLLSVARDAADVAPGLASVTIFDVLLRRGRSGGVSNWYLVGAFAVAGMVGI